MKITTRTATTEDAEAACSVLRRSITVCCVDDHHNQPNLLSAWLQNKTPENLAAWIAAKQNFSLVAVTEERVIGVALLTDKGNLGLCYVLPEVRFQGVGKAMLRDIESHAAKSGLNSIYLSSTATARSFYLRNGYKQTGELHVEFGIQAYPLRKQFGATRSLNKNR